ncbi:hypothetical protein RRG08_036239 [Elysia crispata]|uniref:Uncharacterized protein n=1 Tax=Elysia crispata TaxID=231223 RepID=A0AAE0XEH0_9GAST|nr:hypothetical protein RRG08_036239 [Elysia crispata]
MYIVQVILGVALMKISADDGKLCESHGQCYGRQSLNQQTCRVGRCRIHPDSRVYNLSNNPAVSRHPLGVKKIEYFLLKGDKNTRSSSIPSEKALCASTNEGISEDMFYNTEL